MNQTNRFFSEHDLKDNDSKAAKKWHDELRIFSKMKYEEIEAWRDRVIPHLPRLDKIVFEKPSSPKTKTDK